MPHVPGYQPAMQQHVETGQSRRHREHGEGGAIAGELDGEARRRGPDESGDRGAKREGGEVPGALGWCAERADQVVDRDVEIDVAEAEERRAEKQRGQPAHGDGKREPARHREAAERDRHAHAIAIRDPAGLHREQQRKHREQRRQHADRGGAGAEVQGVERDHHLAAALRDRIQQRQQHHQVDRHVPLCRMRFARMGRVY